MRTIKRNGFIEVEGEGNFDRLSLLHFRPEQFSGSQYEYDEKYGGWIIINIQGQATGLHCSKSDLIEFKIALGIVRPE